MQKHHCCTRFLKYPGTWYRTHPSVGDPRTPDTCTSLTTSSRKPDGSCGVIINTSSEWNSAARECSSSRSDQSRGQQLKAMEAKVHVMPTPTVLPTVTSKAQRRSTSLTKRAAEPTSLDVPPQAKQPRGEGSQTDVQSHDSWN